MKFALDKSLRTVDADGRLHISKSHISKAMICPYMGKEIPGYDQLGLDAEKIYRLFRDPVELEKGAKTFARLPILSEHVPVNIDEPRQDLIVGSIGSDVEFADPYLDADLCFWDASSIAGIDSGKLKELSCAYRYVPIMEPGEFKGELFDGRMTQIEGNHLATVETGRAGPDVVVADSNPFTFKELTMKMTKLGKALFAALGAAYPILAADAALSTLVGSSVKKTFEKDKIKSKLMALDASIDSNKLDTVLDAILDNVEDPNPTQPPQDPGATDESPADKVRAMLKGKVEDGMIDEICKMMGTPAKDSKNPEGNDDEEEPTENDKPVAAKDMQKAMDSMEATLRKRLMDAAEAARDVRPVVGDVIGMDSAADVYAFALDHMKVDHTDIKDGRALRALFKVANRNSTIDPSIIAQDGDGLTKQFPNAARFRNA